MKSRLIRNSLLTARQMDVDEQLKWVSAQSMPKGHVIIQSE